MFSYKFYEHLENVTPSRMVWMVTFCNSAPMTHHTLHHPQLEEKKEKCIGKVPWVFPTPLGYPTPPEIFIPPGISQGGLGFPRGIFVLNFRSQTL